MDSRISAVYTNHGVLVADIRAAFAGSDFSDRVPLPGFGILPLNVADVCRWTFICAPPNNIHPTTAGYGVMAGAVGDRLAVAGQP